MTGFRDRLFTCTQQLMAEPLAYVPCREAAFALKDLFEEAVDFDETPATISHIETDRGRAVSTVSAAICIIDYMRTRVFLQGIAEAIAHVRSQHPERPVRILYAGCGPFATLLTPLTTLFSPEEFMAQLLDLNEISIGLLRKTIHAFGMQDYVHSIIHADATQYKVPDDFIPDMIISETMLQALVREPIVNIYANLAPQCPDAIMIPEQVNVSVALYTNPYDNGHHYQLLATLLSLSADSGRLFNQPDQCPAIFQQGVVVNVPARYDERFKRLLLLTDLTIYKQHRLEVNESSLTLPYSMNQHMGINDFPSRIVFRYVRGPVPGFVFEC